MPKAKCTACIVDPITGRERRCKAFRISGSEYCTAHSRTRTMRYKKGRKPPCKKLSRPVGQGYYGCGTPSYADYYGCGCCY